MAKCEKILITVFSGSGKSTLVRELHKTAPENWESFDDLDDLVLKNRGKGHKNLASLIEAVGWEKFRLFERQELEGWLKEEGPGVLALGGGALSQLVWDLYRPSRKILFVFLKVKFETCWERINGDAFNSRPLVKMGPQSLKSVFDERMKIFEQIPNTLDGEKSTDDLTNEFWKILKQDS